MRRVAVVGATPPAAALSARLAVRDDVTRVTVRDDALAEEAPAASATAAPDARAPVEDLAAVRAADLVLLAVEEDVLVPLGRALAAADAAAPGQQWVHLCRGHGVRALRPVALAGADTAACAPLLPVGPPPSRGHSGEEADGGAGGWLDGALWVVTTRSAEAAWPTTLVRELGGEPVVVDESVRARVDAALTIASVGVAALGALARDLLLGAKVAGPEHLLDVVAVPAVRDGARTGGGAIPAPVATGEIGRLAAQADDVGVVLPEALEAYGAVLRLAAGYARRAGTPGDESEAVAGLLGRVCGLDSTAPPA